MALDDHAVQDTLQKRCAVCGTPLTADEVEQARELERPFVCAIHAAELLPAEELAFEDDSGAARH